MAGDKGIIRAFLRVHERAQAAMLAQGVKGVSPARDDLMCIPLMTHVPQYLVQRRVEYIVHGKGEFHGPEA